MIAALILLAQLHVTGCPECEEHLLVGAALGATAQVSFAVADRLDGYEDPANTHDHGVPPASCLLAPSTWPPLTDDEKHGIKLMGSSLAIFSAFAVGKAAYNRSVEHETWSAVGQELGWGALGWVFGTGFGASSRVWIVPTVKPPEGIGGDKHSPEELVVGGRF